MGRSRVLISPHPGLASVCGLSSSRPFLLPDLKFVTFPPNFKALYLSVRFHPSPQTPPPPRFSSSQRSVWAPLGRGRWGDTLWDPAPPRAGADPVTRAARNSGTLVPGDAPWLRGPGLGQGRAPRAGGSVPCGDPGSTPSLLPRLVIAREGTPSFPVFLI